jgi:ferredoxin-NADP reductase/ferredoxin
MPRVRVGDRELRCDAGELLLDVLARAELPVAAGCRAGACQSCLVRIAGVAPPPAAQRGLWPAQIAQGFALSCQMPVEDDCEVVVGDGRRALTVEVEEISRPAPEIACLRLRPKEPFSYLPGQFVHVVHPAGVARPYSLAGLPTDTALEIHVRRLAGGAVSPWLCDELRPGDELTLRGPAGSTCYTPDALEQPLLLAGVGTGLAPLMGIARAALAAGHRGAITFLHAARERSGLYAHAALRALSAEGRVAYQGWVLAGGAPAESIEEGDATAAVATWARANPKGRVFLCGSLDFVKAAQRKAFLAGVGSKDILADTFLPSG